jgi:hypothetical protein
MKALPKVRFENASQSTVSLIDREQEILRKSEESMPISLLPRSTIPKIPFISY